MSLIKQYGMPVYKTEVGFKYPMALKYYEDHDAMVWHKSDYSLSKDIADYERADEKEKSDIMKVMQLFTQNDVMAGIGYDTLIPIIKPTEVKFMLRSFSDRESTHAFNYANFTDTLGIGDKVYTEFLEIPIMSTKTEYLDKAKVMKYEDYKRVGLSDAEVNKEFRRAIARMIGVYAGGLEGVSLMAQFAMLLQFQFQGKYPGLCSIVEWSIKDETLHLVGNSWLFRTYISENPDIWDDELKADIYGAIREVVEYEHALIDFINPAHISNESLKRYVEYCADNALSELGMKRNYNTVTNPLPYMDDVVGTIQTDFFSGAVTEYSKVLEGDWEEVNYAKWKAHIDV